MATLKWTLAALKSTLMALRLRVDAEVASILGEPEVVAALDARLPVSGSEVVDLCTPTPDAPGPSAGDKRPAPDSGSQRPNRKANDGGCGKGRAMR